MVVIEHNAVGQKQKVIVSNKRGEKLVGIMRETGSGELVVLCHGFLSTKENNVIVNLADALEKRGISSFCFDFAGNGESDGVLQDVYWGEVDDLEAVVQHFSIENRVVTAIIGHSKGGDVVLLYASLNCDIPTIVSISGRYDLEQGIEKRLGTNYMQKIQEEGFIDVKNDKGISYRVTKENLTERLNLNIREACLKIEEECRVLVVHGSADKIVPVKDAREFASVIRNCKLEIIKRANHGYVSHQPQLISAVINFICGRAPDETIVNS